MTMRLPLCYVFLCSALLSTAIMPLLTVAGEADVDLLEAARQERLGRWFEEQATVLTLFDRSGGFLQTVKEAGLYSDLALSPDGTRIALSWNDIKTERTDVWVFEVASGNTTRITTSGHWDMEWAKSPVWSPAGSSLAYVAKRDGYEGIYLSKVGEPDAAALIYQHPGADLWISDWSMDGEWLSFSTTNIAGGTVYVLPIESEGLSEPVELLTSEFRLRAGGFSPDGRLLSYSTDETGTDQVYVLEVETATKNRADGIPAPTLAGQRVSAASARFAVRSGWRGDGSELYYVAGDGSFVAVDVRESGSGTSVGLFRPSQAIRLRPDLVAMSRAGNRVLIAVPHAPKLERITIFNRQGRVLHRVGEPGIYRNPTFSPDGRQVAAMRRVPDTGHLDIWTFDVETGNGRPLTADSADDNWPLWSPDGSEIAYRSERGIYAGIYLRAANGTGAEQQVYQYTPGAFLQLTDWSANGSVLTFQDGCWGVLHVVPLQDPAAGLRPAVEWLRDEYLVAQLSISPDSRYAAYQTDKLQPDEFYLYVSPFDPTTSTVGQSIDGAVRLEAEPIEGILGWHEDGRELYYLNLDWEVKSVQLSLQPEIRFEQPKVLFRLQERLPGNPKQWKNVSADGSRFVFVDTVPAEPY